MDGLAEYTRGRVCALAPEPPQVAIAIESIRRCNRFLHPVVRQHPGTVSQLAIGKGKQTDPAVISERCVETAATEFTATPLAKIPACIVLHAERLPDLLTQVGRQIVADCRAQQRAHEVCFGSVVVVDFPCRSESGFNPQLFVNTQRVPFDGIDVSFRVGIVLVPFHAGRLVTSS